MDSAPSQAHLRAFAEALRQRLLEREDVAVPRLGAFRVEHQPSRVERSEGAPPSLAPPRDYVTFEPDA